MEQLARRPRGPRWGACLRMASALVLVLVGLYSLAAPAQARARSDHGHGAGPPAAPAHWQLAVTTPAAPTDGEAPLPFKDIYGNQPSGSALVNLAGVSCANVFFCAAVGQYEDATGAYSGLLDVLWHGSWHAYAAPEPALDPAGAGPGISGNDSGEYSGLEAVSCPAVGTCVAVGSYRDSQGQGWGLIETFSDGTWRALAAPEPARNDAGEGPGELQTYTGLYSVSCGSATSCVAVGMYNDAAEFSYGLIDTLSNGKWTALDAPEPARDGLGAKRGTDDNSFQAADLSAVTCNSPTYCMAVGDYKDAKGVEWPLVVNFSGAKWQALSVPEPPRSTALAKEAAAAAPGQTYGFLSSIACAAEGECTAVGAYADATQQRFGLLESLYKGNWTAAAAPEPSKDASGEGAGTVANGQADATLSAVACPSAKSCVSVGNYKDASGSSTGLVDVLNHGGWQAVTAPEPHTDALGGRPGSDLTGEADTSLTTVSCQPAGVCMSAGTYNDALGNSVGLIDLFAAGTWQAVAAPAPSSPFQLGITTRQAVTVTDVACSPDGTCALVGTYEDGQGNTFGLIDRYRH